MLVCVGASGLEPLTAAGHYYVIIISPTSAREHVWKLLIKIQWRAGTLLKQWSKRAEYKFTACNPAGVVSQMIVLYIIAIEL